MATLYIIRGLPGSGKSTLARKLVSESMHFEADMFHIVDGEYRFDAANLKASHQWCEQCVASALLSNADVAVSNTFTRRWEYQPYIDMANESGHDVLVVDCHGAWDNVHNVPEDVLASMAARWEPHER